MITAMIPAEFEPFIANQLATGRYHSAQDVVLDALRLLREQGHETLRKEIQIGVDELDRGEGTVIEDEESLKRFFNVYPKPAELIAG